jgi:hypothetical protein
MLSQGFSNEHRIAHTRKVSPHRETDATPKQLHVSTSLNQSASANPFFPTYDTGALRRIYRWSALGPRPCLTLRLVLAFSLFVCRLPFAVCRLSTVLFFVRRSPIASIHHVPHPSRTFAGHP